MRMNMPAENKYSNYSIRVSGYSWIEDGNDIWLSMTNRNAICKIDCVSSKASIIAQFPGYDIIDRDLYYFSLYVDHKVIFFPRRAKEAAIYDIRKKDLEMVPLKKPESIFSVRYNGGLKFADGLLYHSSVYMFGFRYPAIVKLDIDTMKLIYLTDWMAYYPYMKEDAEFFAQGHLQIGSDVYLAIKNTNSIVKLNLETDMMEVFSVKCSAKKFMAVAAYKDSACLFSWKDYRIDIILWNPLTNAVIEYSIETNKDAKALAVYWIPVLIENCVYLFPLYGHDVYAMNLDTGEAFECKEIEKKIVGSNDLPYDFSVSSVKNVSGEIVFQTTGDSLWHKYNPATKTIVSHSYIISDNLYNEKYWTAKYAASGEKIINEADMSAPFFIDGIRWI